MFVQTCYSLQTVASVVLSCWSSNVFKLQLITNKLEQTLHYYSCHPGSYQHYGWSVEIFPALSKTLFPLLFFLAMMVITLMEYAIYLQAITAHNGDELDPHSGKLNTFPPFTTKIVRHFYLIDSHLIYILFELILLTFMRNFRSSLI